MVGKKGLKNIVCILMLSFSSLSLASDCESLKHVKGHVHICDCPDDMKSHGKAKENDREGQLRELAIELCDTFPMGMDWKNNNFVEIPDTILNAGVSSKDSWGEIRVDIRQLKAEKLSSLSQEDLVLLMHLLGMKKVKVDWVDRHKHKNSHRWDTNAASALGMMLAVERKADLLSTLVALAPDQFLPLFESKQAVVADYHFVTNVLLKMTKRIAEDTLLSTPKVGAQLVAQHLKFWSKKNPKILSALLVQLVLKMSNMMSEDPDYRFNIQQRGILLGVLFAGSLKYAAEIKSKDEKNIWLVNTGSNLVWAATTFLGCVPIAANIAAGVAGVISIVSVSAAAAYSKKGARDLSGTVKEVEGAIEFKLLSAASQTKEDVNTLLAWMKATIHVNGFAD